MDDDGLAEALGAEKASDAKEASARVARIYLARRVGSDPGTLKIANAKMSPWEGEDHEWPTVNEAVWDTNPTQEDRFGDVFVMEYIAYGRAGTPKVTVDTRPWIHDSRREFKYTIEVFGEQVEDGKIKLDSYEREIPKLLKEALDRAGKEAAKHAKQLTQLKVPNWEITYDLGSDDMVVEYKAPGRSPYSDSNMSGSFYSPLDIFTGGKSDYDISYSQGADYEGSYGKRELNGVARSLDDIKKALRDAEALWKKAESKAS